MLQNAYFLAKVGADTAENEREFAENLPKIGNYTLQGPRRPAVAHHRAANALELSCVCLPAAHAFFFKEEEEERDHGHQC